MDLAQTAAWLAARPADAPFGYVVTPNAEHLVQLAGDPGLAEVYRAALLRLLDSRVVARAAAALGLAAPPVVPGSDLVATLLARHLAPGDRLTVIGLQPEYLPLLRQRCGPVAIAHHLPPVAFEHDPTAFRIALDFALAHPARFTLLAVGMPRQELLAAALRNSGRARGTGLCIGSALEYFIGARRRAPRVLQRASLEWAYRLCHEPRRLGRRYLLQSPRIFPLLLRERLGAIRPGR
ncbi:WecB/TagA/CpsF family glycosyltransferase [Rhodovastum atsumiense]|uniref:WecB/TagA/CpsF family glycosyltransferase n=1 Tax=Rhodovastum atsumiense TaxID=504468 RepID=A0A5M6IX11_9PROT|nr:WecB/TagA/CpsF family glycosyltransferase [Rhodovastum atsumiense]KAA5612870.1 WecB/TagA/CpsF family glycosyltransferase [Rhodovastum atsumiense]CAH2601058.1 WecB/TagA/CpsF family glycosyltransferase [Rhodovastum atsumiense]